MYEYLQGRLRFRSLELPLVQPTPDQQDACVANSSSHGGA
jgi:hypothetical protein